MLKGKSNLVFIGFMGSGKSSVSIQLGQKLGKRVISTDAMIIEKTGKSIQEIFETFGEAHFRALEKEVVKEISALTDIIIDCGGGIICDQENIDLLKKNGCLIYLAASPEFLYEQVMDQKDRPLLNVEDPLTRMKELMEERKEHYKQADVTLISEDREVEEICEEVLELMKND